MIDTLFDYFHRYYKVAIVIIVGIILLAFGFWYFEKQFRKEIVFKNELILSYNTGVVYPIDYIDQVDHKPLSQLQINNDTITIGKWKLKVDKAIDTSVIGKTTIYFTTNEKNPRRYEKVVEVKDLEPPVITFKKEVVTLFKSQIENFNYRDNIANVEDDYDSSDLVYLQPKSQLSIVDDAGEYEFNVEATDSSGNSMDYEFKVRIEEDPKPEPEIIYIDRPVYIEQPSTSTKPSNPAPATTPSTKPSQQTVHGTKKYMFTDGYTLDSGYDACVADGQQYGTYTCSPLKNDEGIYIGYELKY